MTEAINNQRAEALFLKLHNRFSEIKIADDEAGEVTDAKDARFFVFRFSVGGKSFGRVTVSMLTSKDLSVYYARDITKDMTDSERKAWYNFLKELRLFAKANMLMFDVRDISNVAFMSHRQRPKAINTITESKTKTKTYVTKFSPEVKVLTKKNKEGVIESVFLETVEGERYRLPFKSADGIRAMAQHVTNKGSVSDDFGKHIIETVNKISSLAKFKRVAKNKSIDTLESESAANMLSVAESEYHEARKNLRRLGSSKGYKKYKAAWPGYGWVGSGVNTGGSGAVSEIRAAFTEKKFDERLEDALPFISQALGKNSKEKDTKVKRDQTKKKPQPKGLQEHYLGELDDYLTQLTEETWKLPNDEKEINRLHDLITNELIAGPDGINASTALYGVIGDDDLTEYIRTISVDNAESDIAKEVRAWLRDNMPDLFIKVFPDGDPDEETKEKPKMDEDVAALLRLSGQSKLTTQ